MKRPGDTESTVALIPETKRSRADVILYNNKDKALLEAVRSHQPTHNPI